MNEDIGYIEFRTLVRLEPLLLLKYISNTLKNKYGYNVELTDKFLIAEGDLPICLIAHADTVFQSPPSEVYYDDSHDILWSPQGLGADDRAGIYAILRILEQFDKEYDGALPHVIITTGEEQGGIGAYALIEKYNTAPFEMKFMIELDRQGEEDCVFYDCDNKDFVKTISKYGFVEKYGTFSDISILAPAWGVAAVNLSVGYYQEHSQAEYLKMDELMLTVRKVINILSHETKLPSFSYIPKINHFKRNRYSICSICDNPIKQKGFISDPCLGSICKNCYDKYFI